jgi:hypothetical protein
MELGRSLELEMGRSDTHSKLVEIATMPANLGKCSKYVLKRTGSQASKFNVS